MIHKVILQTQQGNIRFANCLTDISAIILKYCGSRIHFIIFQLDYILKLYLSQDKYIAFHLHAFILLNGMCIEGQDALFQDDRKVLLFMWVVIKSVKLLLSNSFLISLHWTFLQSQIMIEFAYKLTLQHC